MLRTKQERAVVRMHLVDGLSRREIHRRTGWSIWRVCLHIDQFYRDLLTVGIRRERLAPGELCGITQSLLARAERCDAKPDPKSDVKSPSSPDTHFMRIA